MFEPIINGTKHMYIPRLMFLDKTGKLRYDVINEDEPYWSQFGYKRVSQSRISEKKCLLMIYIYF